MLDILKTSDFTKEIASYGGVMASVADNSVAFQILCREISVVDERTVVSSEDWHIHEFVDLTPRCTSELTVTIMRSIGQLNIV